MKKWACKCQDFVRIAVPSFGTYLEMKEISIKEKDSNVKIINSYVEDSKKVTVQDFVAHFKSRYNGLKDILQTRIELRDVVSINRVHNKNNEKIALIGMVNSKRTTKNNNIILEIEDLTGT